MRHEYNCFTPAQDTYGMNIKKQTSQKPKKSYNSPQFNGKGNVDMLFACDIGNTSISLGVFDGDSMVMDSKIATSYEKSADEYAILLTGIFAMHHVDVLSIKEAIISSVVRPLNTTMLHAIEKTMHVTPMFVGPGLKTGLNIKTDIPSQMGADIVSNAVAAVSMHASPMVILDLGTATTLTAINEKGELCGVLIIPGIRSSLNALSAQAAELPRISLEKPRAFLGKNTIDSMMSGVVYGNASMIDGLLDRIKEEWKVENLTVIATGGLADIILPYCRPGTVIHLEANLTLQGLKIIHRLNANRKI